MKILQIITMGAYAYASVLLMTSAAQEPMKCSCTPNSYSFKLNFHGTCSSNSNPIMNNKNNPGITGSMCYFVRGGNPEDDILNYMDSLGGGAGADGAFPSHTFDDNNHQKRLGGGTAVTDNIENYNDNNDDKLWMDRTLLNLDFTKQIEHTQVVSLALNQQHPILQAHTPTDTQSPLDLTRPTIITSVIFLEIDTTPELNIINQDSTLFDIDKGADHDDLLLTYESVSSKLDIHLPLDKQSVNHMPGGVILVLFGLNAANEVIQNRIAWRYTQNYCNDMPFLSDGIGWVALDSYQPPYSKFCEGVADDNDSSMPRSGPLATVTAARRATAVDGSKLSTPTTESKAAKSSTLLGKGQDPMSKSAKTKKTKGSVDMLPVDAKAKKYGTKSEKKGGKGKSKSSKATKVEAVFKGHAKSTKGMNCINLFICLILSSALVANFILIASLHIAYYNLHVSSSVQQIQGIQSQWCWCWWRQ